MINLKNIITILLIFAVTTCLCNHLNFSNKHINSSTHHHSCPDVAMDTSKAQSNTCEKCPNKQPKISSSESYFHTETFAFFLVHCDLPKSTLFSVSLNFLKYKTPPPLNTIKFNC